MDELRECPFCGKHVAELTTAKELEVCSNFKDLEKCPYHDPVEESQYTVICSYIRGGCGATNGYFIDPDKAILRWNTRERAGGEFRWNVANHRMSRYLQLFNGND